MRHNHSVSLAVLATSIALALGSTAVMAATAPPAATQLPGQGKVTTTSPAPTVVVDATAGTMDIVLNSNTVIDWGKGTASTDINKDGTAGFNIGKSAVVSFAGNFGVLNLDSTGNPSQIMGTLTGAGVGTNVYVANSNGIIVGSTATISSTGAVGLIANTRGTTTFDGSASSTSIEYQGSGGTVDVATGANISGTTVLVSGGNVNIDLGAIKGGSLTVTAGVKNSTSTLVHDNTGATLAAAGSLGGASLASFASAGDASSTGTLTLGTTRVGGTLTNTGTLTLGAGFAIGGVLVNNKTVNSVDANFGGLTNNGDFTATGAVSVAGDFINEGKFTGGTIVFAPFPPFPVIPTALSTTDGAFTNNGQISGVDISVSGGNMSNAGVISGRGTLNVAAGDVANSGSMEVSGVYVLNGSIVNNGVLTGVTNVATASHSGADGFTAGANYSVTNTGKITAAGSLFVNANSSDWHNHNGTKNDSTGSVINTGVLQVNTASFIDLGAHGDVSLAGTVQAYNGAKYAAPSATNPLSFLRVYAGDYANPGSGYVLNADGVATVSADIATKGGAMIVGNQVKLMSNLSSVDAMGAPTGMIDIIAGAKQDGDYALRVAKDKAITASIISINGDVAGDEPNVIVQGTLAAATMIFGGANPVSDVFTGPTGGLSLAGVGFAPNLELNFTGAVKTVPYNNTPTNFRYNGLQVTASGGPLFLVLQPVAYTSSGTADGSAVNILVNGDVKLGDKKVGATVHAGDSAVTGVASIPNTHLVLQSSGNITTIGDGTFDFYWPGYVYLGNVAADAAGHALPGTLGLGTITTLGEFNNVLPGDVSGASGIHFITQFPLSIGGDVVTNANAWVNFGTDLLTQAYASGTLAKGQFFGGVNTVGTVVSYGELDEANFHMHAPTDAK